MKANLDLTVHAFGAMFVVLAATTLCGRLARLIRQPTVVGEMVAGVLLGPSFFGAVAPGLQHHLFNTNVKSVLYVLSMIGLTFYMFLVGTEVDHGTLDRRTTRRAGVLAVSGIVPSFALGAGSAFIFYHTLSRPDVSRWNFMLFLGGALSITAFPMLARILEERGITRTPLGGLTLVAAAIDDAAAWGVLAVVVAVASAGGPADVALTIGGAAAFALVMLTVGTRLLTVFARSVERDGTLRREKMAIVLLLVLAAGYFTEEIGIFTVFGGFITGLAMPDRPMLRRELRTRLTDVNSILLLPVFFAYSGLNTRLGGLDSWTMAAMLLLVVAVAVVGKYGGCLLGARSQGTSWRQASAIGGLMNARGLMILIFINISMSYDLVSSETFSILVIAAIVTTAMALPVYRVSMPDWLEENERAAARAPAADVETVPAASRGGSLVVGNEVSPTSA
ncbi:Kef-type K+ transport system, membrane component [Frankia torreyi]|uniref:Kef-type K+ transport system, membrane component n=1 Tax=Frankia torreyi TaxID=1856 RepID=A0A0D8B9Z2_9ACTN|nr:Kef-type K+ transport system, membrane component [Frankia torreyi]KQM03634.1 Kef-type K+ transport system, membrane component [Frankia sp. CpI1-P]